MAGSATLIPTSSGPPRGSKDGRMAVRHAHIKCVAGRVAPFGWPPPCGMAPHVLPWNACGVAAATSRLARGSRAWQFDVAAATRPDVACA